MPGKNNALQQLKDIAGVSGTWTPTLSPEDDAEQTDAMERVLRAQFSEQSKWALLHRKAGNHEDAQHFAQLALKTRKLLDLIEGGALTPLTGDPE